MYGNTVGHVRDRFKPVPYDRQHNTRSRQASLPEYDWYHDSRVKVHENGEIDRIENIRPNPYDVGKEEVYVTWKNWRHHDPSWISSKYVEPALLSSFREFRDKEARQQSEKLEKRHHMAESNKCWKTRFANAAPANMTSHDVVNLEDSSSSVTLGDIMPGPSKRTRSATSSSFREEKQLGRRSQKGPEKVQADLQKYTEVRQAKERKKQGNSCDNSIVIDDHEETRGDGSGSQLDPYSFRAFSEENSAIKAQPEQRKCGVNRRNFRQRGGDDDRSIMEVAGALSVNTSSPESRKERRSNEENRLDESQKTFIMRQLKLYHEKDSDLIEDLPITMNGRVVDLYALYTLVNNNGGVKKCGTKWTEFCHELELPSGSGAKLKKIYESYFPGGFMGLLRTLATSAHEIFADPQAQTSASLGEPSISSLGRGASKRRDSDVVELDRDSSDLGSINVLPKRKAGKGMKQSTLNFQTIEDEPNSNSSNVSLHARRKTIFTEPSTSSSPAESSDIVLSDASRADSEEIPIPSTPQYYMKVMPEETRPPGFDTNTQTVYHMFRILRGMEHREGIFYFVLYNGEESYRLMSTKEILLWNPELEEDLDDAEKAHQKRL